MWCFFFSSRRRHTRFKCDWSSDVCSSDLYGEHYAEACEQGRLRLFSYRTGTAQPRITVSAQVRDDGRLRIDQIKGKQNRPPIARYLADVLALLNHLDTDGEAPADALAMGI